MNNIRCPYCRRITKDYMLELHIATAHSKKPLLSNGEIKILRKKYNEEIKNKRLFKKKLKNAHQRKLKEEIEEVVKEFKATKYKKTKEELGKSWLNIVKSHHLQKSYYANIL